MEYALIKSNKVVNIILADADFISSIQADYDHIEPIDTVQEQGAGVGWDYINGKLTAPVVEQVAIPPITKITCLAFLNRFSDAEAITIDLASQGNTVEAAALRRYQKKVDAAAFIDLANQDTRNGVIALESMNILSLGRAFEILDSPVTTEERYNVNSN